MNGQNGYGLFDLLNLASLMVGLANLNENREQSAHNDVQRENTKQTEYLLTEIAQLFGELNRRLSEQDRTLAKIEKMIEKWGKIEMKNERIIEISKTLKDLGISPALQGYTYLREALELVMDDIELANRGGITKIYIPL